MDYVPLVNILSMYIVDFEVNREHVAHFEHIAHVRYVTDVGHIDQVIQNGVNMNTLQGYQTRVSTIRRQVEVSLTSSTLSNVSTNAPRGLNFFRLFYFWQVRGAMEIALFIQNIQEERAEVALYIFIDQV